MEKKKVVAVYAGTFDPVTNGHLDIIERASQNTQLVKINNISFLEVLRKKMSNG